MVTTEMRDPVQLTILLTLPHICLPPSPLHHPPPPPQSSPVNCLHQRGYAIALKSTLPFLPSTPPHLPCNSLAHRCQCFVVESWQAHRLSSSLLFIARACESEPHESQSCRRLSCKRNSARAKAPATIHTRLAVTMTTKTDPSAACRTSTFSATTVVSIKKARNCDTKISSTDRLERK